MSIGVLSDIHGNLFALEAVVRDMLRRGISRVVNLGDSLSGPLLPRETGEYLLSQQWFHLAGNHERQILEYHRPSGGFDSDGYARSQLTPSLLEWIRTLRPFAAPEPDVVYCYGTPKDDTQYLAETVTAEGLRIASAAELSQRLEGMRARLVLCGHSHIPRAIRNDGTLIVNPGSVGLQAYTSRYPCPHRVENASVDARYAVVQKIGDEWIADLVSVPYDFAAAAALAQRHGADAWALALRTGRASSSSS